MINSQNIWHRKNLENKKRKVTHHIQGLLNKTSDFKTDFSLEIMETKGSEMTFTMLNQIRLSTKNSIQIILYYIIYIYTHIYIREKLRCKEKKEMEKLVLIKASVEGKNRVAGRLKQEDTRQYRNTC